MPTDTQLAASGFAHAGAYLAALEVAEPDTLKAMAAEQACEWGGTPKEEVGGQMPRRVTHLVDVIVRKIRKPGEQDADAPMAVLTRSEFRHWALGCVQGSKDTMLPDKWASSKALGEQEVPR